MLREEGTIGAGIVVLSASFHILHMNRRATDLLTRLAGRAISEKPPRLLLAPVYERCLCILKALQDGLESNNHQPVLQDSTIGPSTYPVLLRGFGLPDSRGLCHSRIVVMLNPDPNNSSVRNAATMYFPVNKGPSSGSNSCK